MSYYDKDLDIEKAITDKCLIEGDFLLSSGIRSSYYFDKYLFESDPKLLHNIVVRMAEQTIDQWNDIDYIAGLEMGGISIATMLSHYLNLPLLQVRKKKKEYGTAKVVEGPDFNGKRVVIIEDVITSGKAVLKGCNDLREEGAIVNEVHCVILRDNKGKESLDKTGLTLYSLLDINNMDD